jgi:hypothetical protein
LGGRHAPLHKNKRVTRKKLATNKLKLPPKSDGNRPRAPYFKHYRAERTALSVLENTFTITHTRKTYRANRYLYYAVIPHLAKYLWFEPDRVRLRDVERSLFNELLSYSFMRGRHKEPYRVQIWSFRSPTVIHGHKQQKL